MLDRPLIITAIITIPPKVQWLSIRSIATPIFAKVSWAPKSNCSHEIKRCLFLGRKAMINLDSILKNRDITWLTKVCTVKAMVFLVIMYRCENEHQRIDAFQLWSWRRLESPLDSKEIKPINPKGNPP